MNNQVKTLMLALGLLALTACGDSMRLSGGNDRPEEVPPASLTQPCEEPVTLPNREAAQGESERWWRTDRVNLARCASAHAGLTDWVARTMGTRP